MLNDLPPNPIPAPPSKKFARDLTKREIFAAMALQGFCSDINCLRWIDKLADGDDSLSYDIAAREAVHYADSLIKKLGEKK